ncbi:hypothetical protein ACFPM3_07035 [Streptomyces coeruleoprunus]|uniref:Uncharacterized protein n=1 Tax=Streptomyces coeruleoprunus TaxID=285563 RepID=A0ABV9X8V1_9ACTN
MFRNRPRERRLTRSAAVVAAALATTLVAASQTSARPPFPSGPFLLANEALGGCLRLEAGKPALGNCGSQRWVHLNDSEALQYLPTGQCLTRAARVDDCGKADDDPARFTVRADPAGEVSFEVFFQYSDDTRFFLQARPDGKVTTSTQQPGDRLLGLWSFR